MSCGAQLKVFEERHRPQATRTVRRAGRRSLQARLRRRASPPIRSPDHRLDQLDVLGLRRDPHRHLLRDEELLAGKAAIEDIAAYLVRPLSLEKLVDLWLLTLK